MNKFLEEILASEKVFDGKDWHKLHSNMGANEGHMIQSAIEKIKAHSGLEIGFAYGISAMFACEALRANDPNARHLVIDPCQETDWNRIGLRNCCEAGYGDMVSWLNEKSEICLPRLMGQGLKVDFAIIDGWHTFDQAMVDFYYVNRMLNVGGVVVLDDVYYPSLNKLIRYLLGYPAYRLWGVCHNSLAADAFFKEVKANELLTEDVREKIDWKTVPAENFGCCIALQKVEEDQRGWDWFSDF